MKRLSTFLSILALGAGLAVANQMAGDRPSSPSVPTAAGCEGSAADPLLEDGAATGETARSEAEPSDLLELSGGSILGSSASGVPACPSIYSCRSRCKGQACHPGGCTQFDIGSTCMLSNGTVFLCAPGKTIHVTSCGVCEREVMGCLVCDHIGSQNWSCQ